MQISTDAAGSVNVKKSPRAPSFNFESYPGWLPLSNQSRRLRGSRCISHAKRGIAPCKRNVLFFLTYNQAVATLEKYNVYPSRFNGLNRQDYEAAVENFALLGAYIPSEANVLSDSLSRLENDRVRRLRPTTDMNKFP